MASGIKINKAGECGTFSISKDKVEMSKEIVPLNCKDVPLSCDACSCLFNKKKLCHANGISIIGNTDCATYIER
jgi:hypothetical protein